VPRSAVDEPDQTFSDAYLRLRARFLGLGPFSRQNGGREKTAPAPDQFKDAPALTEKTLRAVWYESRYDRRGLSTLDGERVSVLQPGEWNLDAGPDFRGAEIRIGDRLFRGDVELHLTARDWKGHGHDGDPAYDGVVLHVFLSVPRGPVKIRTSDGKNVPSVCLAGRLPEPLAALVAQFDAESYPYNSHCGLGACGRKLNFRRFDLFEKLLRLAGDGRILLKGALPEESGKPVDFDRAFYGKLLESLGYQPNKAAMAALAERLPWRKVESALDHARSEDRPDVLQALLFGTAGLLPQPSAFWDGETNSILKKLNGWWGEFVPNPAAEKPPAWTFRRLRPANFPQRRLAGLSFFLARNWERLKPDFFRKLADEVSDATWFAVGPEGYFARRCAWGGKPFGRPAALIGPDRARAIWTNAFLPLAVRLAKTENRVDLEHRLHRAYRGLPLKEWNGLARLMAHRALGSEKTRKFPIKHERHQQGLLQIFQDFCDTKPWACSMCVFPQVLELSLSEIERSL
jgi:hypothetical protein